MHFQFSHINSPGPKSDRAKNIERFMHGDLSFQVRLKSREIDMRKYTIHYFENLFSSLLHSPICKGPTVGIEKNTSSRDNAVAGITEKWTTTDDATPYLRHRFILPKSALTFRRKIQKLSNVFQQIYTKRFSSTHLISLQNPACKKNRNILYYRVTSCTEVS